ncbi:hypothetical protein GE09DRAFT_696608 [Coniochaeta sp. 2T2.1]|nr:hypothetical protein GE09DRAFT_696608 [Coniochaeta sp. 2T2.1]
MLISITAQDRSGVDTRRSLRYPSTSPRRLVEMPHDTWTKQYDRPSYSHCGVGVLLGAYSLGLLPLLHRMMTVRLTGVQYRTECFPHVFHGALVVDRIGDIPLPTCHLHSPPSLIWTRPVVAWCGEVHTPSILCNNMKQTVGDGNDDKRHDALAWSLQFGHHGMKNQLPLGSIISTAAENQPCQVQRLPTGR